MAQTVNRAESFEIIKHAYKQINYAAFDYATVKESLIQYIKLYFSEVFNDFTESSELIMIINCFAYFSELFAYRVDMSSQENFIQAAEIKKNVLALAKWVSYTASRNLPARGLVKIDSIVVTADVFDSENNNIKNREIRWNDQNNPRWKEQFLLAIQQIIQQQFGNVTPKERVQLDDILFELYTIKNLPVANNVLKYNATVSGVNVPMEIVPAALSTQGLEERTPQVTPQLTMVYGNDGLGDGSPTTGFFFYTKQGTLGNTRFTFDGVTPNITRTLSTQNVNEIDVWLNEVDPDTGDVLNTWTRVDAVNGNNVLFNNLKVDKKFEIETLENDRIRLIFGDGVFSEIPNGTFDLWYRASSPDGSPIPQKSVVESQINFNYSGDDGSVNTCVLTVSLINSLQNASASEDIQHIKDNAPLVYSTQGRMVTGEDYQTFMMQDPSILKLKTLNRTFAGDSKYIRWHDPSGTYENVIVMANDLALYHDPVTVNQEVLNVAPEILLTNNIEQLLFNPDLIAFLTEQNAVEPTRTYFTTGLNSEHDAILTAMGVSNNTNPSPPPPLYPIALYKDTSVDLWHVANRTKDSNNNIIMDDHDAIIIDRVLNNSTTIWTITYRGIRLIAESAQHNFWTYNNVARIDQISSSAISDKLVLLKANLNKDNDGILDHAFEFPILRIATEMTDANIGIEIPNKLVISYPDENLDTIPDEFSFGITNDPDNAIIDPELTLSTVLDGGEYFVELPVGRDAFEATDDVIYVKTTANVPVTFTYENSGRPWSPTRLLKVNTTDATVKVRVRDYVYWRRSTAGGVWKLVQNPSSDIIYEFALTEGVETDNTLVRRRNGKNNLNFVWNYTTPNLHLIDPAPSNIMDVFIITVGYYKQFMDWISGTTNIEPTLPQPFELKNSYNELLDFRVQSDSMIFHPGKIKLLFGPNAVPELQAKFKVIRGDDIKVTDIQLKNMIITATYNFFNISNWEFGETFYFQQLSSYISEQLGNKVKSVVVVPLTSDNHFGTLFQVNAREDEILQAQLRPEDIEIVQSYNNVNLKIA